MVLQCFSWILRLLNLITSNTISDTLPAQIVRQCPKAKATNLEVCKNRDDCDDNTVFGEGDSLFTSKAWSSCTMRRPLILQYYRDEYFKLSITDGKWEKKCKKKELKELGCVGFISSCDGLVLLESYLECLVFDPLSEERITRIDLPSRGWGAPPSCRPCGLFYHPLAKEYRILAIQRVSCIYEYHLYLFRSNVWRRTYNPIFFCGLHEESMNTNPAIAHGCLHWYKGGYTEGIIIFNIIDEEFSIRYLPFEQSYRGDYVVMRDLLVIDDRLCLCHVGRGRVMDVWVLENHEKWDWTKKYSVNLDWDGYKYPMERGLQVSSTPTLIVVSIRDDVLLLFWRYRGLFSYNLRTNTIEKLHLRKTIVDKWDGGSYRDRDVYRKFCGFVACTSH